MVQPNVFILSVDSLRYDYFADAQEKIADMVNGVAFENAVATASQTSSSMPTLATGAYTDDMDTWGLPESGEPIPLAEQLADSGYDGGLWTDNFLFGEEYNYNRGFNAGNMGRPSWKKRASKRLQESPAKSIFGFVEWSYFNVYKNLSDRLPTEEYLYEPAESLNSSALSWLNDCGGNPTLCWIHYMDPHHPFEPPKTYLDRVEFNHNWVRSELSQFTRNVIKANGNGYSDAEIEDVALAYEACCKYTQDALIKFIEALIKQNHFDPTADVLVLTADHGECLSPAQTDMMGHVPPAFWEEIVRVPLVVATPGWEQDTVNDQVSLSELVPTIAQNVDALQKEQSYSKKPTPNKLVVNNAFFVTEWEDPDTGETRIYRGIRRQDGWKLFGTRKKDKDIIVLSKYDAGEKPIQEIVFQSDDGSLPTEEKLRSIWDGLYDTLEQRGVPIEDEGGLVGGLDKEHLRNLGYLE